MTITREMRSPTRSKINHDLGQLETCELLFLWRHRQPSKGGTIGRAGAAMSQMDAAVQFKLSISAYKKLEAGQQTLLSIDSVLSMIPTVREIVPTIGELCFLARRRSGLLLSSLERELGVSRPHYHALERAGNPRIVDSWIARGFIFPLEEDRKLRA